MNLNQATINTLQSLFGAMDKSELHQALKLLVNEWFKRDWGEVSRENKINPVTLKEAS